MWIQGNWQQTLNDMPSSNFQYTRLLEVVWLVRFFSWHSWQYVWASKCSMYGGHVSSIGLGMMQWLLSTGFNLLCCISTHMPCREDLRKGPFLSQSSSLNFMLCQIWTWLYLFYFHSNWPDTLVILVEIYLVCLVWNMILYLSPWGDSHFNHEFIHTVPLATWFLPQSRPLPGYNGAGTVLISKPAMGWLLIVLWDGFMRTSGLWYVIMCTPLDKHGKFACYVVDIALQSVPYVPNLRAAPRVRAV